MNKRLSRPTLLRKIWMQLNKEAAEKIILDWVKQTQGNKVPQLIKMAATIMAYRTGILAWTTVLYRQG